MATKSPPSEATLRNPNPDAYIAIKLWLQQSRFPLHDILDQQICASEDNAPLNAIYYSHNDERWMTTDDLPAQSMFLQSFLKQYGKLTGEENNS